MTKRQDEKDEKDAQDQQRRESQQRVDEEARRRETLARQSAEEQRYKAAMAQAQSKPEAKAEPEAPKPPPVFSVASRPPVDLSREDGEPLGDIPAPWVYTLVGMDGTIGGALMADAEAEWLDVGPHHLRVEMVPVPTLTRGVPVVFLPPAMISEVADPKVTPPDVFSGQTGLAGTANEALMRNYHNRPLRGLAGAASDSQKIARRVVIADPAKPAPAKPAKKAANVD